MSWWISAPELGSVSMSFMACLLGMAVGGKI